MTYINRDKAIKIALASMTDDCKDPATSFVISGDGLAKAMNDAIQDYLDSDPMLNKYIRKQIHDDRMRAFLSPATKHTKAALSDEENRALQESQSNADADTYFEARPFLRSALNRLIFEAGHSKGWTACPR